MLKQLKYLALATMISLSCFAEEIDIPLNPLREYDFKDRDYIFKVRKETIENNPILGIQNYNPMASPVFRQVQDGKPWWGLSGINCYGNGQHSIEGLSEESRFIENPYLLIPVEEAHAYHIVNPPEKCPLAFPRATSLTFDSEKKVFRVKYDFSSFYYKTLKQFAHQHRSGFDASLHLTGKNALDLGYPYVYAKFIKNIKFTERKNVAQDVYQLKDFIHVGGSCGYKGGCNNGSPHQGELDFHIQKLPAKIILKLWKNKPSSKDDKSDLIYIIELS